MKFSLHYLILLTLFSSVELVACQTGDPAILDCQQLLESINTTVVQAQNLTQAENKNTQTSELNLETWLQAADVLKAGATAIAKLKLRDSQVKTYQKEITDIYNDQAQSTYDMVKARQEKNLDLALKAKEKAKQAGDRELVTGEALNTYCQTKKKNLTK